MTYEVSVIRDKEDLQRAIPEWRDFVSSTSRGSCFFNDPDVIEFDVCQGDVLPFIVMVRQAGVLQCVAPLRVQPSGFQLQFSVFTLATFPVQLMTMWGNGFIFRKDAAVGECCAQIFDTVRADNFDLIFLNAVETDSPLGNYCASNNYKPAGLRFARPARIIDHTYRLELPATFSEYLGTLGSNTRASLKRRAKKLIACHGAEMVRITSADQVPTFLNAVDEVYRDSWQAKRLGPNKFNNASELARFRHVAQHGWLRSYLLLGDRGPLAFQVAYQYGDALHACDFAFAQQWSKYGPGAVLMYLMLEDLYQDVSPRVVDLREGASGQKRSFRAVPHAVADCYVIRRNSWRHVIAAQRGLSEIEAVGRTVIMMTGLDNAVRRYLKPKR
jgi:hypothetical protein